MASSKENFYHILARPAGKDFVHKPNKAYHVPSGKDDKHSGTHIGQNP